MINVSDTFKEKLKDGEKVWEEVEITFPDGTVKTLNSEIMSGNNTFSDCAESSSFPIGCVICKSMTLELDNTTDQWKDYYFYRSTVHAYLKMQIDDNTIESIDKGTYTIVTPEQYGEILSFTALDDMYKTDSTYTSTLSLPQTIESLVRDACGTLGYKFGDTMKHGDMIINELPESMTFRQFFGWAAQIESANIRLDNKGNIKFLKWDFSNVQQDYSASLDDDKNIVFHGGSNIDSDNFITPKGNWIIDTDGFLILLESADDTAEKLEDFFSSPKVSSDDIVITGVRVKKNEDSELYGETGYVIELENNLIDTADIATVAAWIGDAIIGVKFRSMNGELAYNPLIEFGDMVYTYNYKRNRYITPITDVSSTLNGKTTVKTQADDPIRGESRFISESMKAIIEARRLVKAEKTAREKALEEFGKRIDSATGVYTTEEIQEDGSRIFYLHDKPTLAESKAIWKMTSEAWGVSTDGGKTWNGGMTVDGDTIVRILNAVGVNAEWINAGAITVKDSNGNLLFQVDMDTKKVYISGDCVLIGGKTASEALADNLEESKKYSDEVAAKAKNMTMQLSNDVQTITTDADGNITEFPTVSTKATVMYGSTDITNDCSYVIAKSDNITGSWNEDTHVYNVTGLSTDDGWIDIKATYLDNLSVTKRFTVSKVRAGAQGTPGRTYILEPSCNVLKRGSDKVIAPNFLEFKAYYRDGNEATRHPYAGRFVIEETTDGTTWNTIYTSSTDESTVKHYLYTILTDGTGQTITDGNGTTVGIPRDVTNIRCRLYQTGGTVNMCDMQSVAVVIDVDNLTQTQIVEILSDNGAWKGLYYKNGHLYISFDAALGGELSLGGENNGNGILRNYDENGVLISEVTKDGLVFFENGTLISAVMQKDKVIFFKEKFDITKKGSQKFSGFIINNGQIKTISGSYSLNPDSSSSGDIEIIEESDTGISVGEDTGDYLELNGYFDIFSCVKATIYDGTATFSTVTITDSLIVKDVAEFKKNDDIEIRKPMLLRDGCSVYKYPTVTTGYNAYINMNTYQISKFSSSSERYKVLGGELSKEFIENLYGICPRMAKYKDGYIDESDERNGVEFPMFIAEDVEKYFPLAVDHINDQTENWNERIMIPAMFAMIKEQKAEIDSLKQEIQEIEKLIGKE